MNYEEKYKNALERARKELKECVHKDCDDTTRRTAIAIINNLFPELKESKGERIRKEIIDFLKLPHHQFVGKRDHEKWIAWLEKQGEKENTSKREIDDAHLQGICDAKHAIEKQGESTRTNIEIPFGESDSELQEVSYSIPEGFYAEIKDDRVVIKKAKFKVGDWLVVNNANIYQVVKIEDNRYELYNQYGGTLSVPINFTYGLRLWTINDAKEGDVLAINWREDNDSFEKIIIFKKYHNKGVKGLYSMPCVEGYGNTFKNGKLAFHEEVPYYSKTWTDNLYPATKEQCDLLFEKMKEAGYEYDSEKKELNKIEIKTMQSQ